MMMPDKPRSKYQKFYSVYFLHNESGHFIKISINKMIVKRINAS